MGERMFPQLERQTRARITNDIKLLSRLSGIDYQLVAVEETSAWESDIQPQAADLPEYGNELGSVLPEQAVRMGITVETTSGQTDTEAL